MNALMQNNALLISSLLEHAARHHPDVEIVSHLDMRTCVRTTWRKVAQRAARLASALRTLGIQPGARVATLAWNTHRHLELYYAASGMGAVLHTVNPRLFPEQIAYIVNHAADELVFFDLGFAPLLEQVAPQLKSVKGFVAMCSRAELPALNLPGPLLCYEDLVADAEPLAEWPALDENTASSLCYTSGTTGNPKGVLYSHRSTVLHSWAACAADGLQLCARDSVLLAVPMFHVNAWGIPYAAAMCGAKLVLPGPDLGGERLFNLMRDERCTFSLGVPTVWLGFFQHAEKLDAAARAALCLERVVVGGSAAPRAIVEKFEHLFGAYVIQAWGMTETSPLATICNLLPRHEGIPLEERFDVQTRQGRAIFGVEIAVFDAEGRRLPADDHTPGELKVRGPWVVSAYYGQEPGAELDANGWFATGDVALIDKDGYVQITDRSKDVIKSGGEWISSIDLENLAVGHPKVKEAAVIGAYHSKWQERPLLIVVPNEGAQVTAAEILGFMQDRVARWWMPDDVVFVDELPHTATGKLLKTRLREQFQGHRLPTDAAVAD
ncbi:long-chain-fatty-acid--CoA ligase [Variovorax sp. Root434]|uniref:long-chain-fatty-acid--CoA ligase n=1 Tax=Variovorax sp. Root434 TaxID=1736536 RepID=UPI0006FB9443|nr:long-chain-fatty-acid--CoA ligase [Variovorax sp. Root434]KQX19870.1 long-chain fatty acid--CoA ligase [Variovorax sp. Root434]